ncbi:hypothetical protein JTB14_031194 [Gonioctena quinquepunctata]|nr:hypothetical protein JTB14_031194 [Gonioctena quinquepunctata]
MAFFFLELFGYLNPASKYLQTEGLHFMQTNNAKGRIKNMYENFGSLKNLADKFIKYQTDKDELSDVDIESEFPKSRTSKKKKMPDDFVQPDQYKNLN